MDLSKLVPWRRAPKESPGFEFGVAGYAATGGTVRTSRWLGYVPKNPTVSIAVNFVMTNWAEAPFVVEDTDGARIEGHYAEDWPSVVDVRGGLWHSSVSDYMSFGNVYWLIGRKGDAPAAVRLDPARVEVHAGPDGLVGRYRYQPRHGSPFWLQPGEVLHVRHGVDGASSLVGSSPLHGLAREIMQDNMAGAYSLGLMQRYGLVGATFTPEQGAGTMGAEERKAFKEAIQEAFTLEGAGSALVAPPGYKVEYPAKGPESVALEGLREWPQARILAALGLSPMAVGLPDQNKTYSNLIEARDSAWEQCIAPMKRTFAAAMSRAWSASRWRYGIDLSSVRALGDDSQKVADTASRLYASGVIDRAEARRMVGEEERPEDVGFFATDLPGLGAKSLTDRMRAAQAARSVEPNG